MDPRAYDNDAFERQAARKLIVWPALTLLALLVAGALWRQMGDPFVENYDKRLQKWKDANEILSFDSCLDYAKRARSGSFSTCAEAELTRSKFVVVQALYDTLREQRLFSGGKLVFFLIFV
jgi:hypothetical protein